MRLLRPSSMTLDLFAGYCAFSEFCPCCMLLPENRSTSIVFPCERSIMILRLCFDLGQFDISFATLSFKVTRTDYFPNTLSILSSVSCPKTYNRNPYCTFRRAFENHLGTLVGPRLSYQFFFPISKTSATATYP